MVMGLPLSVKFKKDGQIVHEANVTLGCIIQRSFEHDAISAAQYDLSEAIKSGQIPKEAAEWTELEMDGRTLSRAQVKAAFAKKTNQFKP